ncbi:MAG: inositol 2-dehydrogenase [Anaerolineae bacterium]|nr:MAG: inositol 2-dehydrogenase [Anaerolineae bacterium]WKZ43227.1 MAG: inositol 2-dehydrogenase [Anaerolineales bacterium]
MTTKHDLRFGVIGGGRIGKIHAENLATRIPGVRVAAIADVNLQAAQELAARLHIPIATDDYRVILSDSSIDAVAICSSTDTHAQIIVEAAQAGKHIFCEKPIAYDLAKIDAALEAVEKAGVKLQIGFNRRFDPNFRRVRAMVAEGKVGAPHIIRITSRDPAPPPLAYIKGSGGMFFDMTIHDFDMARYLSGSEVEEVYVAAGVMVDPGIGEAGDVDTAVIVLRFANGAIGTIDNSRKAVYGYDQRVEVFGSEGMVQAQNNTPDNDIYFNAEGVQSAKPLYFFLERYMESFIAEQRDFVQSIRDDTAPPVVGNDGRIPVVIGMAAKKSYLENRPVKLSEIESLSHQVA